MIHTIVYGFTIGAILYFIAIGLSLTFGMMRVINFAHTLTYTIGVYMLVSLGALFKGYFVIAAMIAVVVVIPISYLIERCIIRRLY
ncbi:MAG: branched-chain amino acid ABC transporter permease, partial [Desulfobacterales bacterium]|nr:branched-chain amino acid ABC transporter permease [Desulfobacterales bacterium]